MQVTTIVGPALTRPLFHSWIVLIFYEKLDYIKESRPNMDDPSTLGNISKCKIYLQELMNQTTCNHFNIRVRS